MGIIPVKLRLLLSGTCLLMAAPIEAAITYIGQAFSYDQSGSHGFGFSYASPDYINSSRTIDYSLTGQSTSNTCSFSGTPGGAFCSSLTFLPHATIDGRTGDYITAYYDTSRSAQLYFPDNTFASPGAYGGSAIIDDVPNGSGSISIAADGPGAPAPVLGAGLLSSLASLGGLCATRIRRRKRVDR